MHRAEPMGRWNVLNDNCVTRFQNDAVEVLACLHETVNEPASQLALAVLALVKDRNEWRSYAERVAPVASVSNGEGPP
jgi:hypothetical protein